MYVLRTFEDTEAALVKGLKAAISELGVSARVATKRLPQNKRTATVDEVIVQWIDDSVSDNNVKVYSDFTIYVYCFDENENVATKRANDLKRAVMSALKLAAIRSGLFRSVSDVSSSNFEDEGQAQVRSILATFVYYTK